MKRNGLLDSRQLEAFEVLCSTGSFTETAKRLFLTQSAVSHSMKSLEDEVGSQLFRRQGKKFSITEAGDRLLRFARPYLAEMQSLRDELSGFEKFGSGRLRLGASPQACRFLLPPILKKFKEVHPHCRFEVKADDTPKCLEMLNQGEIDLEWMDRTATANEFLEAISDVRGIGPTAAQDLMLYRPTTQAYFPSSKIKGEEKGLRKWIILSYGGDPFRTSEAEFERMIKPWKGCEASAIEFFHLNWVMEYKRRKAERKRNKKSR